MRILNSSEKPIDWLACETCLGATRHRLLHSINEAIWDGPDYRIGTVTWSIVRCEGCETYSFLSINEEMYGSDHEGKSLLDVKKVLYPRRAIGRPPLSHTSHLPKQVKLMYTQTREAICNDMNVLAGIGLRALVETVCKERNAQGSNLKDRIDSLVKIGDLTLAGANILHSLRTMGNAAAHEVIAHSSQDLATAFEVVEHLLMGIYILPAKASKLPK